MKEDYILIEYTTIPDYINQIEDKLREYNKDGFRADLIAEQDMKGGIS